MMQPTNSSRRILLPVKGWFIFLTLFVALFLNLLPLGRITGVPDWVALVLAFWCVREPLKVGMATGFALGLISDVADASLMGQHALAYVLLAFAATLLGLKSEHVLAHALAAARWGLLFLLALWLVEAVFGRRRRTATAKPAIRETGHSGGPTYPAPVAVVPPPGVFEDFQSERPRDQDFR